MAGPTVNLLISPPRGGHGDTAVNLMMIERLAGAYAQTDTKLNIVYTKDSVEQIKTLWPDFRPELKRQLIRGLVFTEFDPEIQLPADVLITFSALYRPLSRLIYEKLGQRLLFYEEYGQVTDSTTMEGYNQLDMATDPQGEKSPFRNADGKFLFAETGFDNGLYVLKNFRPEDSNLTLTLNALRAHVTRTGPWPELPPDIQLGYAYSTSKALTQDYVDAVAKFSERHQKPYLVVTNHHVLAPENSRVVVLTLPQMPFTLGQKLIKSASLPILVTGDSSVSVATEGAKPFMYSLYSWKQFSVQKLMEAVLSRSKFLRSDRAAAEQLHHMFSLDLSGATPYAEAFLNYFENRPLQQELTKVLAQITDEMSLIPRLEKDIEALRDMEEYRTSKSAVLTMLHLARKAKNLKQAVSQTKAYILNPRYEPRTRLRYFLALRSLKSFSDADAGKVMSRMLTDPDRRMNLEMSFFIQNSVERPALTTVLPHLTPAAYQNYVKALQNLAHQPVDQWGTRAKLATTVLETQMPSDFPQPLKCEVFFGR